MENQKTKIDTAFSRPSETALAKQKSDISLPLPIEKASLPPSPSSPVPTTTSKKAEEKELEENYPPVIKRKQKEPKQQELDVVKQLKDICYTVDPNDIYKDMIKIGQGYMCITREPRVYKLTVVRASIAHQVAYLLLIVHLQTTMVKRQQCLWPSNK